VQTILRHQVCRDPSGLGEVRWTDALTTTPTALDQPGRPPDAPRGRTRRLLAVESDPGARIVLANVDGCLGESAVLIQRTFLLDLGLCSGSPLTPEPGRS
jgi:hypothetical protein